MKLRKDGRLYLADIVMKPGHGLPLSRVEKALETANRKMGDSMGTKYEVDGSLALAFVHRFKTKERPDEAKLRAALAKLPGFKSVTVDETGFKLVFEGEKQAMFGEVRKAAGEVEDVILAASKDGFRYWCPMCPDNASASPAKCPVCDMEMSRTAASAGTSKPGGGSEATQKCDSCGAKNPEDGCKKGCGACKKKCGTCCGKGCGKGGGS